MRLERWREAAREEKAEAREKIMDEKYALIKEERMPDGKIKRILRDRKTGKIIQKILNG